MKVAGGFGGGWVEFGTWGLGRVGRRLRGWGVVTWDDLGVRVGRLGGGWEGWGTGQKISLSLSSDLGWEGIGLMFPTRHRERRSGVNL